MIVNTVQLSGSLSATSPHHQAERERDRERIKSGLALRFAAQMGLLFSTVFNRNIPTQTNGNSSTHPLKHTIGTLTCLIHILHDILHHICTDSCCSDHSHLLINDKCPCPMCETRRFLQLSGSLSPNQCVLLLYGFYSVYCKSS